MTLYQRHIRALRTCLRASRILPAPLAGHWRAEALKHTAALRRILSERSLTRGRA